MPQLVCITLLLWAIFGNNPYGYYIVLRWICCATLGWLWWRAYKMDRPNSAWLFGVSALVYNPVIRVHATREFWGVLNAITIVIFIASLFALRPSRVDDYRGHQ
jgi:uncharacterized membrane protein